MEASLQKNKTREIFFQKKYYLTVLKIVIAVGLISFILYKINPAEVFSAIKNSNLYLILTSFGLTSLNLTLQYKKWKLTSSYLLQESESKKIWYSLFFGIAAGSFTPARVGEYFGRALEFKDKPILQVTIATLIDKFFAFVIVTVIGSIASILFLSYYYHVNSFITVSLFIVLFLLFYFFIILLLHPKLWNNIVVNYLKSKKMLSGFIKQLEIIKSIDKNYSSKMIGWTVLFYTCYITQFALLAAAFTNHNNFFHYLWAGNLVMFAKSILPPVSLAEIGIREGASVFFLTKMGELAPSAFDASIFLFLINVLFPSLIGVVLLFKKNNA